MTFLVAERKVHSYIQQDFPVLQNMSGAVHSKFCCFLLKK